MKLFFYRGLETNFGDELNESLLPRVFGEGFFDSEESTRFLGIGSILYDRHPAQLKKVVFSSGYGGYGGVPTLDAQWDVFCVRGPRTAKALGLDESYVSGDGAILVNLYRELNPVKKYRFSFMPHFESLKLGAWAEVAELAGVHLIDPRSPVDEVLHDIQASEVVIAEAMHGAIVADALRTPWIALSPVQEVHRAKWYDWAEALDMTLQPATLRPSTAAEALKIFTGKESKGRLITPLLRAFDLPCKALAARSLRQATRLAPMLSADRALDRSLDRLQSAARNIRNTYGAR